MSYYDDEMKKHDAASMTLAKLGLLLALVSGCTISRLQATWLALVLRRKPK